MKRQYESKNNGESSKKEYYDNFDELMEEMQKTSFSEENENSLKKKQKNNTQDIVVKYTDFTYDDLLQDTKYLGKIIETIGDDSNSILN